MWYPLLRSLHTNDVLQVTKEVFEASNGRLKVVGRAGVGVDNVDLNAATQVDHPIPSKFIKANELAIHFSTTDEQLPCFDHGFHQMHFVPWAKIVRPCVWPETSPSISRNPKDCNNQQSMNIWTTTKLGFGERRASVTLPCGTVLCDV